ncbi:MAG: hypothetical protein R3B99_36540 [Polyangiales bacterium]|nr:hypothetical protein [Sandaracinus sp.]
MTEPDSDSVVRRGARSLGRSILLDGLGELFAQVAFYGLMALFALPAVLLDGWVARVAQGMLIVVPLAGLAWMVKRRRRPEDLPGTF